MDTAKSILLATTIILFAIGMWPTAILTAVAAITLSEVINHQRKKQFMELKSEVDALKKKIMEDAERQEKED